MKHSTARLTVVCTSIVGGSAYLVAQGILAEMGPLTLSSMRFLLAGAVLFIICKWRKLQFSRALIVSSLIPGVALGTAMTCMVIGLKGSLSTVAAFLVCSDAFFIPLVDRAFFGRKTSNATLACLGLGAAGLALLTLQHGLQIAPSDAWLLVAAFMWAVYCSTLGHVVRSYNALAMSCAAHLTAGGLVAMVCYWIEAPPQSLSWQAVAGILYFALIISALRFTLKAHAQQVLTPSEMGLLFLIEPISAALIGGIFAAEVLSRTQWAGACLILSAVAIPSLLQAQGEI